MNGKKTYILAALGALSALALYAQGVILNGFDFTELLKFVNSEAMIGALAALRHAFGKK